jgi:ribonucleoside-diphosphate reductase alpha chain
MDVGANDQGQLVSVPTPGKEPRCLSETLHKFSSLAAKSDKYVQNIPVNGLTITVNAGIAIDQACPECGMPINHESGCVVCTHCGFSKCG